MRWPTICIRTAFLAVGIVVTGCANLEPFRNVSCFDSTKVSLKDAVTLAEQQGGKAIDVRYRQDRELGCLQNDSGVYDVTLMAGSEVKIVSIDAGNGQAGPQKSKSPDFGRNAIEKVFTGGARTAKPDAVPELSITILQAVDIAEREGRGKAIVAWADRNEGQPGYSVKLVENGKTRTTWVNGRG